MNECKGFAGMLFGHKFQAMHNIYPPSFESLKITRGTAVGAIAFIQALTRQEVSGVWCARCGAQVKEEVNGPEKVMVELR